MLDIEIRTHLSLTTVLDIEIRSCLTHLLFTTVELEATREYGDQSLTTVLDSLVSSKYVVSRV